MVDGTENPFHVTWRAATTQDPFTSLHDGLR
jgi:hypothetical protein